MNGAGKPVQAVMTERQTQLLAFLERNRYATFDDIHAYLSGDPTALRYTIRVLKARPNAYIKVCDPHVEERNLRRKLAYELDKRGIEYLRQNGRVIPDRRYVRNFTHAALASHATASIEAGISVTPNARLITWSEILASQNMPAATKRMEHPAGMHIAYEIEGVIREKTVRADSSPFGIVLELADRKKFRFFPGIEADTGTEPITVSDFERTSIFSKFKAYLAIEAAETYRTHFGFPVFFVPFITTSASRMRSMMDELDRITDGRGSKTLIFKVANRESTPGYLFAEPWERVGHDPIILLK
ncbi:MAG: replication-relaxation family protein [Roseiarcus sp.]